MEILLDIYCTLSTLHSSFSKQHATVKFDFVPFRLLLFFAITIHVHRFLFGAVVRIPYCCCCCCRFPIIMIIWALLLFFMYSILLMMIIHLKLCIVLLWDVVYFDNCSFIEPLWPSHVLGPTLKCVVIVMEAAREKEDNTNLGRERKVVFFLSRKTAGDVWETWICWMRVCLCGIYSINIVSHEMCRVHIEHNTLITVLNEEGNK